MFSMSAVSGRTGSKRVNGQICAGINLEVKCVKHD